MSKRYEDNFLLYCSCADYGGELVSDFIELGVDLSCTDAIFNRDAYGWLSKSHNKSHSADIAEKIYASGYRNIDATDKFKKTALDYAMDYDNNQMACFFQKINGLTNTITISRKSNMIDIFSISSVQREKDRHCTESNIQKRLLDLEKSGPSKELVAVKNDTIENIINLKKDFPHFSAVIDHIGRSLLLQALCPKECTTHSKECTTHSKIRIPAPIMLYGTPGSGKTRFVNEVAKILKTPFSNIDCGNTCPKFAFSGTPPTYQNADCSKVVSAIGKHTIANPIILMDELDKLSSTNDDAYSSLYALLEGYQAKSFHDHFYNIEFDLSHVLWFATANQLNNIPDPIISRMDLFEIENPDKNQTLKIVDSIYKDLRHIHYDDFGRFFPEIMTSDVLTYMSEYSPREIKSIIQRSFGFAAERFLVTKDDIECKIDVSDIEKSADPKIRKTQIGFVRD
jgi:ATP-dependent Lon protease